MIAPFRRILALAFFALTPLAPALAAPQLADVFSDNMVLQRGAPMHIFGAADPGEALTVSFAGKTRKATADAAGAWAVDLPARRKGGPFTLTVKGADGEQSVKNVLVGDVFLCSGQSNMEFPIYRALNPDGVLAQADDPSIRLLTVEKAAAATPQKTLAGSPTWQIASADTVRPFSAVCYLFAKDLQRTEDVPLGLIHSSWGGSRIEPWIGEDGLRAVGAYNDKLDLLDEYARDKRAALADFGASWEKWWNGIDGADKTPWATTASGKGWKKVPGAMRDYHDYGDAALADFKGMIWFRKNFTLTAAEAKEDGVLSLGGIDEVDAVWVNGKFLNASFGWGDKRNYPLPADVLKEGDNVVVVNVYNSWGAGGMVGPGEGMKIAFDGGDSVAMGTGWRYQVVPPQYGPPQRTPWESIGGYATLSNAMIAPLGGLAMKGGLWYQGESNAEQADVYGPLLKALVKDWRGRFGADMPVIVIQLPDFGKLAHGPTDTGWTRLRDVQRRVAAADPKVGLVVTLDVGDRDDIHPSNKQVVGRRAADVARVIIYGEKGAGPADGHSPLEAARQGDAVVVTFRNAVTADNVVDAAGPIGFQLCDAAGVCAYADATLEDGAVAVSSSKVKDPAEVRYCWADVPICNLYDADSRPYTPFSLKLGAGE